MRQVQSTSIEDECHEAVLDFIQNLSADESELFEATEKSQQLIDDLREVDDCQKGSISRKLGPGITKFVAGVEQYGTALDVLAGSVSLMSPIWASVRVVLSVAKEFGEYFEKLSNMLEEIGEHLSTLRRYPRLYPDNKILQEAMVDIFQAIVQFCVKARNVFHQGKKHQKGVRAFTPVGLHTAWKLIWKPFNSQFGGIVGDIKSAMARIQHEVEIAEKELASEERSKAERERQRQTDRWDKLESNQKSVTKYIDQQRITQVNNWLAPVNAASNHNAATKLRHDGTGVWFLESSPFQNWLSTENSFLWLHAIPGAGKTILASTVINYLREHKQNQDVALAYFYCDYKDTQKQSPTSIVSTLLSTIASQNDEVFLRIQKFFEEQLKENPGYAPEFDELLNNFSHFVGDSFEEIFIIIDALDESEDRECVAYATKSISESCSSFRVFVTSRNEVDIARTFENLPNTSIEPEDVAGDIRLYVETEVAAKIKARKLKLRDPKLSQIISDRLIQGAHGMFQWVKCQIDQLCRLRNDKAVRNALDDLPKTLHDTYFRILQRLQNENEDEVEIVHRLLRWLVRGVRNLTLSELAECVSISPAEAEDTFDFDAVFTDPEDVIELCGSLVSQSANGSVGLAHYTVKEFLVSESLRDVMPQFWVGNGEVHTELASVCLTYLCFDDFSEDQHGNGDALLQKFEEYKFLSYAVQAWGSHARLGDLSDDVFDLIMRLFESGDANKGNYKLWCRIYQHLQKAVGQVLKSSNCTPLYFASLFGLPTVVSAFIENSTDEMDIKEPMKAAGNAGHDDVVQIFLDKCSPVDPSILSQCLYVAASRGHEKVVKQLLDAGAEVDSRGGKNGTALQVAALEGRYDVVAVLLDYKADINLACKRYGVPLASAAEKGHLRTVQRLLEYGANVNGRGGWYAYPLISAIVGKNMQIIDILLGNTADVNAFGGRHGCPLMAAAHMGMLDLIRSLVDHGARVNDENDKGSDALYAACMTGNLAAVELLLELGADVNARGGKHRNALNAASAEGHLEIVKHLLEEGADVEFFDEHYGNAVQVAAFAGHKDIVRVLADAGVDVNASGGDRGTALIAAAQNGDSEIISLLFELGVPSGNTREIDNAIMIAARKGHVEVVEALIEAGAIMNDVSTLSGYPLCTALEAAANKAHPAVIQLLLDRGADVNYCNEGHFSMPLIAAILSDRRSLDIVKMLIDAGADINAIALPDANCACALAVAIYVKDYDIFMYLIDKGADVNSSRANYYSCLQLAAESDDQRVIDVILDKGADVNLQIEDTQVSGGIAVTALQTAALSGSSTTVRKLIEKGARLSVDSKESHFKSALQAACYRGDIDVIQTLIELGSDVDEVGGTYGTALQAAALQQKIDVVRLLLDAGADVNTKNVGENGSALFAAVDKGCEDIVKLLIEREADVNSRLTKEFDNVYPLQAAAYRLDENIVQILLDAGADVNAKGGKYCTALQAAASENGPDECRMLLEHGADPNIVGGVYGTALQAAYAGGFYEAIWLLFDHGASHTLYGGTHGTALGSALSGSCQTLVARLLRQYQADPNAPVRKYGSPIQACIARRSDDAINYLIEENADVNARGGLYGNALIAAVALEDEDALIALLDADADVNLGGNKYYPSPVHAAIGAGDLPTLKRLVERGANLHICGGIRGSTLEYASYKGSLPIVRYLIKQGVDINATSPSRYSTALQAASITGKHEIIKYLVKSGANVNALGGKFGTPLAACMMIGEAESIELLLKRGANPNAKGGIYGYPLQAACAAGYLEGVLILLRYGADVNARGGKYHTALQASCVQYDPDITGLLIERGADVNVVGGAYRSALHAAAIADWDYGLELLMRNGAEWCLVDCKPSQLSEDVLENANEVLQKALQRQEDGWPELSDSEDEDEDDDGDEWEDEEEDGEDDDSDDDEDDEESDDDDDEDSETESEAEEKFVLPWNVDSIPFFDAPYVYREVATADDDGEDDSTSENSSDDSGSIGKTSSKTGDLAMFEPSLERDTVSAAKVDYTKDWAALEWLQIAEGDIGPNDD